MLILADIASCYPPRISRWSNRLNTSGMGIQTRKYRVLAPRRMPPRDEPIETQLSPVRPAQ